MAKNQKKPVKKNTTSKSSQSAASQNRREIAGLICILLAILGAICWFNTDAFLISGLTKFICGLGGQVTRYLLPVVLVYTAVLLFGRKKKPILWRIVSAATLLLTLSALYQLIFCDVHSYGELYKNGILGTSGGLVPGTFALLLSNAITTAGTVILFILLMLVQILALMKITINSLITAIKNRPREEEPEEEEVDAAERLVQQVTTKHRERVERRRAAAEFDLPVDDPPAIEDGKKSVKKNRKLSPDEFIQQKRSDAKTVDMDAKQVTIDEIELHDDLEEEPLNNIRPAAKPVAEPQPEPVAEPEPAPVTPAPAPQPVQAAPVEPPAETNKMKRQETEAQAREIAMEIEASTPAATEYAYPSIELLQLRRQGMVDATAEMRENSKRLADTLKSFGIEPHIVNVIRGPSVTRYEIELDRGVKLSKITNLADDIALSLGATGVRISAIPDKISVVGIEVPNKVVNTVFGREVIDSPAFRNSPSRLSFAVGKDISGNCIVGDIAKLPHMLIAGTTGSGKSVCMNTIILSLLYKSKPDEVRLIMVDPKMVELGGYNGIPHLLIPVVTDPKKAAGALQWTVTEMMRRYRLMSEEGVRDLESYNKTIRNDPEQRPMAQIVVVIDELADLMLVAAKEVEESICRIAQMGRASGIHLVIATQRPSADVITGLMKANIPSRIAFAVSSAMESRIILDTPGAEKLVGKGDMLFAPLGQGKPKRVQGCFISDDEVQAVVNSIKEKTSSDYSTEILEQIEKRAEQNGKGGAEPVAAASSDSDGDELLPAAVEVILETGQASVSMLQRRLKLGYARAARIVDEMEERGIVGPFEGAKPRQLLITREQWEQMQNGSYEANPPVEDEIP